ncbi:MAG: DNA polymerase III subunit delta [Candidatus Tantalella remota]|nr:DNA polymerase III subunit delta [Candidatus Tantalella remota]
MTDNYLIAGDDKFVSEKEIKKIKDKFLSPDEVELNYSVYAAGDIEQIMDSLGTMPFIGEKRVVLVKDAQQLTDGSAETLIAYLEAPSETSVLVLASDGKFPDKKHFKKLSKLLQSVDAKALDAPKMKSGIRAFFKKNGVEISPRAVDLIVELKGTDMRGIKMELEKLLGFSDGQRIEAEHVENLVGRSVSEAIFRLVEALNARNSKKAFHVLYDIYGQKKSPEKDIIKTIGYLAGYMRTIQKVALLLGRGIGPEGIVSAVGGPAWRIKKSIEQARRFSPERIRKWLTCMFTTDRDIKRGFKPAQVAMEMLIVTLINN